MKKILLFFSLTLTACLLAGCGSHTHDCSKDWSADSVGHWHEPLCDCEDVEIIKESHSDQNNDGVCDICGFSEHMHTYSSKWQTNGDYHWNEADCGHAVEGNKGKHADGDTDGLCDTCLMVMGDPDHVHTFENDYSSDASCHWQAATCEHTGAAIREEHQFNAGICTVCGYGTDNIDLDNIAAILAATVAQRKNIVSGKMTHTTGGQLIPITETVSYTLGNNATHLSSHHRLTSGSNRFDTYTEAWLELNSSGVFAVQTVKELQNGTVVGSDGTSLDVITMTPERLLGPYIPHSTLNIDTASSYSIEAMLSEIYAFSQSDMARELTVKHDKSAGKVTFSFGYLVVRQINVSDSLSGTQSGEGDNANIETTSVYRCSYFEIDATFSYSESLAMTAAELAISVYSDQALETSKPDFTYDHESGNISFTADKAADIYKSTFVQNEGTRVYTSKYPQASLVPTNFELLYNGNHVRDSVTVKTGFTTFTLGSLTPATASSKYLDSGSITCQLTDNKTGKPVSFGAVLSNGEFSLYIADAGSYTFEYTYNNVNKSCQIIAISHGPVSIEAFVLHEVWDATGSSSWNEISTEVEGDPKSGPKTAYTIAVGEELYFLPTTLPRLAEQGYTYSFQSSTATLTESTLTKVIVFGELVESHEFLLFQATASGTYVISYTSTADTSITGTFTVTVE